MWPVDAKEQEARQAKYIAWNGCGWRKQGWVWSHDMCSALAGHTFSFSRTSSPDCPMSSVMVWSKENGCIVGVVTLWH